MNKKIITALVIPILLVGCISSEERALRAVALSHIEFRGETFTNVIARMNVLLADSHSNGTPPRIVIDYWIPEVRKRADSPAMDVAMDKCIDEFREKNVSVTNFSDITLKAERLSVWSLLSILPKIEPHIIVRPTPPGAVIAFAGAEQLECRSYPMEPIRYDMDGHPSVIPEEEFLTGQAGQLQGCVPRYAVIHYVYSVKAFVLVATREDHRAFARFLGDMERIERRRRHNKAPEATL